MSKTNILSELAENIIGSEIIKLAAEVNEKIRQGKKIFNLTIGDFNPSVFPIPQELTQYIKEAYNEGNTNYPPADGLPELRNAVQVVLKERAGLSYAPNEILIAAGARPIIYTIFRTIVDPGESVLFAVPSWNNNHYTYLNFAKPVIVEGRPENNFMPSAIDIAPHIQSLSLIALCSPQNPTGTVFKKEELEAICDLILEENKRRDGNKKPLYLMYDQIYWALTFGETKHYDPVSLRPDMRPFTLFVDGISKSLAATGVRVGWSMGPEKIISKMKAILTHIGAWAPKAEQAATAKYLNNLPLYDMFLEEQKNKILKRLQGFYKGLMQLKAEGFSVDAVSPQAAIYLTVRFELKGFKDKEGKKLETTSDITRYLLDVAGLAIVPFFAFGTEAESTWYRLSVGTCKEEDVELVIESLRNALKNLSR